MDDETMIRLLEGTITDEELRRLSSRADTPEGQQELSRQMDVVINRIDDADSTCQPIAQRHARRVRQLLHQRLRRHRSWRRWLAGAAVLTAFLLGGIFVWFLTRPGTSTPTYAEVSTARGERLTVLFQDGTRVQLNADSWMRYPQDFTIKRGVELRGEAYFKVHADPRHPFEVQLPGAGAHLTVRGTEFNVNAYTGDPTASVTLDKGVVEMATDRAQRCTLRPQQQASINVADGTLRLQRVSADQRQSLWTRGIIAFEQTPLQQVLTTLARWYPQAEFHVADPRAYSYGFTLTADASQPLETLLADLQFLSPLRFSRSGSQINVALKE